MSAKTIIQIKNLSKTYQTGDLKTPALTDISFEVKEGEFLAIMGPSGSGKSTLMHILGLLDKPTSGQYILNSQAISDLNEDKMAEIRNRQIGFIFQAYNLLPRTTALKNVTLPLAYAGFSKAERLKRAKHFLELVGLSDRTDYTTNQLSGGQQQRVAIARALAIKPTLLLADEPTGNIASDQAAEIMAIFQQINKEGHTIIMITHEHDIAAYAKRVIQIKDGKIESDKNKFKS